jgi:hypothetical protein
MHRFYSKTYVEIKSIETEALSVKLLALHPTFAVKEKDKVENSMVVLD